MMFLAPSTQSGPSAGYGSDISKRENWSRSSVMCGLSRSSSLNTHCPLRSSGSRAASMREALSILLLLSGRMYRLSPLS